MLGAFFGRAWPTAVWKPMWPFFLAGGIILYGVQKGSAALQDTEEWRNDPRHPAVKRGERPVQPAPGH
ncbi:ATP synthase j chain-domain-containing protein [Kalaharituber pfeilii]|nr:ATP synthase j chain-domain-containing protein [Kalaharituber pfeilii]